MSYVIQNNSIKIPEVSNLHSNFTCSIVNYFAEQMEGKMCLHWFISSIFSVWLRNDRVTFVFITVQ